MDSGLVNTLIISGTLVSVSSPRLLASSFHSSLYPLPSKHTTSITDAIIGFKASIIATLVFLPFASSLSTSVLKILSCSATAAFRVVIAPAQLADDPTARNSNLLPVKANGDVLLRSVLSRKISGISTNPTLLPFLPAISIGVSLGTSSNLCSTSVIVFPRKADTIAGGASLAPSLCALVADAIEALRRALCL